MRIPRSLLSKNKMKKAMEMSLSMVVVAVILLIVLAVTIFILMKGSNNFQEGITACDASHCVESKSGCTGDTPIAIPMKCKMGTSEGNFCCKALSDG